MNHSIALTTLNAQRKKMSMKSTILAVAIFSTFTLTVQAAPNDGIVGAYARVEVGSSNFSLSGALPRTGADESGKAIKAFGGYRFNENFGVEAG